MYPNKSHPVCTQNNCMPIKATHIHSLYTSQCSPVQSPNQKQHYKYFFGGYLKYSLVLPNKVLDFAKHLLNRCKIRTVWGKEHNNSSNTTNQFNHLRYMVDTAIIHYDHSVRIISIKWQQCRQEGSLNK